MTIFSVMDKKNCSILTLLQTNAAFSNSDLAERVNLSLTACWKRVQRMQEPSLIRQQVYLLDSLEAGFGVTVFVSIKMWRHGLEWLSKLALDVKAMPEVMEFY